MEEWRETGYPGYQVNARGEVRGRFGRVLKPWLAGSPGHLYLYVSISGVGHRAVHALVCAGFHGPRPEGKQAAHWDGDKMNNRPENLRWATPGENQADRVRHGTVIYGGPRGEANSHSVLTRRRVAEIRRSDSTVSELAALHGVSTSTIRDILKRRTWKEVDD